MKILIMLLLIASCGKTSNSSGTPNVMTSQLLSESLALKCSRIAYRNRCSRVVSEQVLPSFELLGPYCHRIYANCMAGM